MSDATTLVATTIPVASLTVVLLIVVVAMFLKSKGDARRHKERMLLTEKGMPIPPELYDRAEGSQGKPNGYRAGRAWLMVLGCLMVFVGLGVIVYGAAGGSRPENGFVPLFIGLGFLAAERMIARLAAKADKA